MVFPEAYFEEEVRSGFYISPVIKSCWASQIEVLLEIDRICRKYDIQYFAEWGTLLGTIRHGGFIPWDDDMDIAMKRIDYERFLKIAPKELPEGFKVMNYETVDDYWDVMARVINSDFVTLDPEFLDLYHNCPYPSGIDIFPLDYVANDKEEEDIQRELVNMVKMVADTNGAGNATEEELEWWLDRIESACNQKIDHKGNIKNQLYKILCSLYALYSEEETDRIALVAQYLEHGGSVYPKECYADSVRMPFDVISIPVPVGYDHVLKCKYGDYMKNVRSGGGHNYPYHALHDEYLEKKGAAFPKYQYPKNLMERVKKPTYKENLQEKLKLLGKIHEKIELLVSLGQQETVLTLLNELQNVAVIIGTSVEKKTGEHTETVTLLEQYCEVVFELYQTLSANEIRDGKGVRAILDELLQMVEQSVEQMQLKKEIVFMPYHASHWKAIESVWKRACEDPDCIVRVVPIPYYYKKHMGVALSEQHYDGADFPEYVPVTDFMEYNLEENHPDVIYIQNPHDEWDHALTVHSDYYSPRLWENCGELIYIPWFKLDEMRPDDERALKTRCYFVSAPGVVNADKVIVQSEEMKRSYVDYLCEWAGEETRAIWEAKILGLGSPLDDVTEDVERPAEWGGKKTLLYHVSGNGLFEHKDKMLQKIRSSLKIFEKESDKLQILWLQDEQMRQRLESRVPEVFAEYVQILEECQDKPWINLYAADQEPMVVQLADAFYGDGSKCAQLMKQENKPVMLQNVDV